MTSSNGTISTLLALYAGNLPATGEFPAQKPVTCSLDVFFDLRCHRAHYDVIAMYKTAMIFMQCIVSSYLINIDSRLNCSQMNTGRGISKFDIITEGISVK